jgi:anti-sigma regulatory factor (Ser/Thr protein kinase)
VIARPAGTGGRDVPGVRVIDQRSDGIGASRLRWSFAPEPTAPGEARRRLTPVLAAWGLPPDEVENAVLVVNELVANAVEHARTPLTLTVSWTTGALRVEVRDGSPVEPRLQPADRRAARGRGLQFVQALARRWSWAADRTGKTVWAELPPGEPPRPPGPA